MPEFLKKYKTILMVSLAVLILAAVNLALPEREADICAEPAETAAPEKDTDADAVVISEFMVKNHAVLRDEDGDFSDWIELHNISPHSVSLDGWHISDRPGRQGWAFPDVTLPAGERIILYASGKDRPESLHTDFSLSAGESIYLSNKYDYQVSAVLCPDADGDVSFCLGDDGEYRESIYPGPGYPENAEGYEAFQSSLAAEGPLAINEVQTDGFSGSGHELCGWVEIKNISSEAVDLTDCCLSDEPGHYGRWRFPEGEIFPGEIILVYCGNTAEPESDVRSFRADFSLGSGAEQLYLSVDGELADYVSLRNIPYTCSFGRLPGKGGWFYMDSPSPGAENRNGFRRVSETPHVISGDGVSEGVSRTKVVIEAPGTIYYTTDGSRPDASSELYEGPVRMKKTGVIRAVAVEDGAMPSRVLDISCIINEGHSLPVLSLVSDDREQFDSMYAGGIKELELPGSISLYEDGGGFSIPCGIKIHGETSRILPKKNMSVRFRGGYGQKMLEYDVYGGGVKQFTNFVLRSGQDFYSSIIRNELCQNLSLASSDALISQRSKYCVLYINGRYSGIYSLMEKPNEQHYASIAGVSKDSVTVIESEVPSESDIYQSVFALCMGSDMTLDENYEKFCGMMDADSLIDWIIMEGFCGNNDLTYGNVRYCRSTENDGRWRLMFYDLDSTLYKPEHCFDVLSGFALSTRQISAIIAPLMENGDFRDRLLTRAAELFSSTLSDESVLAEIDRLASQIEPEVERDYARFGMSPDKWQWNVDFIRSFFKDGQWNRQAVDRLCEIFDLSSDERLEYFG